MRKTWKVMLLCAAMFFITGNTAQAAGFSKNDVPGQLKDWIPWVLHGHEEQTCSFQHNDPERHYCSWPSRLSLRLNPVTGEFSQEWHMQIEGWVNLPGNQVIWPQQVLSGNKPVPVVVRNGRPEIKLPAGTHTVTGSFSWKKQPESLPVPPETGLIHLVLNGKSIDSPDIDAQGNLWLSNRDRAGNESDKDKNRLELKVYRHVVDTIPLTITTRIDLDVSGTPREEILGWALPAAYIPVSLTSRLPARLESDGRLRVQVRPGHWTIMFVVRHQGPANEIELTGITKPWPTYEVWVFESQNHLRMVTIEGVEEVDPSQTTLPGEWQHLPAYRLKPGDILKLVEKKRGDPDPEPDKLSLTRNIWLDEDGRGATIQDAITGTMSKGWRLEMQSPGKLGRVAVDGLDQLITKVDGSDTMGVEVRRGHLDLLADSRIDKKISRLPAVGWAHDFQQVKGVLHLPPGWRLFDAGGIDYVRTWLKNWTLLDFFLVLIICLATAKLYGTVWGAVALLTMVLTYHEPGAPRWIWLNLLAVAALLKALPEGKVAVWFTGIRLLLLVFLIIFSIPFMVHQVRLGIYPQLEFNISFQKPAASRMASSYEPELVEESRPAADKLNAPLKSLYKKEGRFAPMEQESRIKGKFPASPSVSGNYEGGQQAGLMQYDTKARIQTGPGLPQWNWRSIQLRWNGPVTADQQVRLVLLSPVVNMLLGFLRVGLLAALILCFFNVKLIKNGGFKMTWPGRKIGAGMLLVFLIMLGSVGAGRAEMPSNERLDELRRLLLEQNDCLPQCADISRMRLEIDRKQLDIILDIQAYAGVAVPLPGNRKEWTPEQVMLDGKPAPGLFRRDDGSLMLLVSAGHHKVLLTGSLPGRNSVQISLPLKPHEVQVKRFGWSVEGLHENGQVDDRLQLQRISKKVKTLESFEVGELPPFVRVERTLRLGLEWQMETRVIRVSPPGTAIILAVPLFEGESVTSGHINIENRHAMINMGPSDSQMYWRSVFKKQDRFVLTAPETTSWTEVWRLDAGPVWHVKTEGIPVVHHQDQSGYWQPEWRPWPGESVAFTVTRPEGVPGPTVTVDDTSLDIKPGLRAADVNLELTIRSSRGDQHTINLPEGVALQKVAINGKSQPIRQNDRAIIVPLVPGTQNIKVSWSQQVGFPLLFRTPAVDTGVAGVNSIIRVHMPYDRWTLLVGGPRTGPAVLFWGELIIILLVAVGLGRVRLTPLRTHHWILLAIGLSQVGIVVSLVVVGWLLALGLREKHGGHVENNDMFDAMQIILAIFTVVALVALFHAIQRGLLGHPDMQIAGNGSTAYDLKWYQDRTGNVLPRAWILSVPLMVYRLAMLAWALWLAFALIKWLRWGWDCFSADGLWRAVQHKIGKKKVKKKGDLKDEPVDKGKPEVSELDKLET